MYFFVGVCKVTLIFCVAMPLFATDSIVNKKNISADILNTIKDLALATVNTKTCKDSLSQLKKLNKVTDNIKMVSDAKNFVNEYCSRQHAPEFVDNKHAYPAIWQEKPYCGEESSFKDKVDKCRFEHRTGKGYVVIKGNESDNYLVCAHAAVWKKRIASYRSFIGYQCGVSNIPWSSINDENLIFKVRSDVRGMIKWAKFSKITNPIVQPTILYQQCKSVFKDSFYCSPTMIVLPTANKNKINVCGLETKELKLRLPFLNLAKVDSKWQCEIHDLNEHVKFNFPSHYDRKCVPTRSGNLSRKCKIPLLATHQDHHLVKSGKCVLKYGVSVCEKEQL